jgi:hypothetical protein
MNAMFATKDFNLLTDVLTLHFMKDNELLFLFVFQSPDTSVYTCFDFRT